MYPERMSTLTDTISSCAEPFRINREANTEKTLRTIVQEVTPCKKTRKKWRFALPVVEGELYLPCFLNQAMSQGFQGILCSTVSFKKPDIVQFQSEPECVRYKIWIGLEVELQWSPGITKCQGTARIPSFYRGFVINGTPI